MNDYCTGSPYCEQDQVCKCEAYEKELIKENYE